MLYLFTGTGGNGKGIVCSYLTTGGGQYVLNAEQTFLTTVYKGGVANSCLAMCEGVRIVLVSEPNADEKSSNLNVDFVKMITGRDRISARLLHKNNKEFDPLFTTFLSCNNKPDIKKLDKGILRRLSIHPFLSEFKANPNPLNKIEMPQYSRDAVDEYVEENNLFKVWFEKNFTKVSMPEKMTKEEKDVWRQTHTHKTSFVLRAYNTDTDSRLDARAMMNAVRFNDISVKTIDGYKSLYYYAYDADASQASTHSLSDEEVIEYGGECD